MTEPFEIEEITSEKPKIKKPLINIIIIGLLLVNIGLSLVIINFLYPVITIQDEQTNTVKRSRVPIVGILEIISRSNNDVLDRANKYLPKDIEVKDPLKDK